MKSLNNRADSHLTSQVELDDTGSGAWVNQGYCGTPPPLPRSAVSTIYNPQPVFQGSVDKLRKLDSPPNPFSEEQPSADRSPVTKRRGCCSFVKGRHVYMCDVIPKSYILHIVLF